MSTRTDAAASTGTTAGGWAYLGVITPIVFGTTYLLTTQFLPPGRPLLTATIRSLPTGLVLIVGSRRPPRQWWGRFVILSLLYSSAFFPLLFVAAYRLPGGVAAVINSLGPIIVVLLSVPWLGIRVRPVQLVAGALGIGGVILLVLQASARLDPVGVGAMVVAVAMLSTATVLTKRWGHPPGMGPIHFTGWTFLLGGIVLLPVTLLVEGLPSRLTGREIGGIVYLAVISGILAYAVWFWALERLPASSVTFLGLLNPVVAAALGWIVLDQRLNGWQLVGAGLVVAAVVLGQLRGRRTRGNQA